jgi:spermidine/putrescine transport system permease protein
LNGQSVPGDGPARYRKRPHAHEVSDRPKPQVLVHRAAGWLGVAPAVLIIGCFMLIPIGIIAVYSFLDADPYGGVRPNFSVEAYLQLVYERDLDDTLQFNSAYLRIFLRSLVLAAAATMLCAVVGFPVAYFVAMQPPRRRNLLVALITVPFWTNLLIRTYCWILILRDTGLINNLLLAAGVIDLPITLLYTYGAILLGLVYTYVPFMVLPIYAAIEKLDRRLLEAAHDLYASRIRVLRRVILPLAAPGIAAGAILVFIPSVGAFIAPDLLGGGKHLMLGSLIQLQFASSRNWPFGSAVAMLLLAVVLVLLLYYAMGPGRAAARGHHP